jgi:DtxR family Mn-dependent transcriptional regulator
MTGLPGFHELREELLERVWTSAESGDTTLSRISELNGDARCRIDALVAEGLLRRDGEKLTLTEPGARIGRHVVRANRLAARLLHDVLELPSENVEALACRLEHAINEQLADSLCTLLGHPPTSPDGRPIPPGACCESSRRQIEAVICELSALPLGTAGRVTFIRSRFQERIDQLSNFGLVPGTDVRLTQKLPSIIIEVGHTVLALDAAVACEIFVKPMS